MAGIMAVKVEHVDQGDLVVDILPPDVMRWERKHSTTMAAFHRSPSMTAIAELAWMALTREGRSSGPFESWADGLVLVEPIASEDDGRPTSGDN